MKKEIKKNCKALVESILQDNLIDANKMLATLLEDIESERESQIAKLITEADEDVDAAAEGGDEAAEDEGLEDDTEDEEGPADNDTDLGDDLDDAVDQPEEDEEEEEDENAVGNAKLAEMTNDEVELQCQVNEKMISIYSDKLANLKTSLNAAGLEKQEREYISLETKISYYSKKLRELQDKCEITVDQEEVKARLDVIEKAIEMLTNELKSLSGASDEDVPDVESNEDLNDDLNDEEETEEEEDVEEETEEDVEEEETEEEE